jgi:enamine deaminase RidA (YjgF/YER057c/UK114 family)
VTGISSWVNISKNAKYWKLRQGNTMLTKEFINPHPMGFTNTVAYTSQGVKTIVVSGQVGYADGRFGETFEEQADMAHRNLVSELEAAGASVADVIKLNSYVVDLDSQRSKALSIAKGKYFTQTDQPASTLIGVSALVMKQLQVEIEATAVIEV